MKERIYPREKYLARLRPFYDSDVIKVITGIRRCGKSCIMKSVIDELVGKGVSKDRILYLPLDRKGFMNIRTPEALEERIEQMLADEGFHYLLIDEVQNVHGFERVVLSYMEEGFSVFLTSSSSFLLSDEISTKLTGRYLKFEVFPLDFKEYLEMRTFFALEGGGDIYDLFNEYMLCGGFPKSLEFPDIASRQFYTREIVGEIFRKDVRTRRKVSNVAVYERVLSFIVNNYSSPFSLPGLMEVLKREGIPTTARTVRNYIEYLQMAKIIYECNRFDLRSRKAIRRDQKYYLADLSIYFAENTDGSISYGPSLENLVYLYLVSNGYRVSVGKIGSFECDFIVRNASQDYAYIQVTYSMQGGSAEDTERIREREYRPFRSIRDGYPRYIVSLDRFRDQREGVHHINAIDLFLGKEKI